MKLSVPERLTATALIFGMLHHLDHVLRYDHSGWPFREVVTGFTYSLAAYPLLLFALLARRASPWWRFGAVGIAATATVFAHTFVETPQAQYARWAWNTAANGVADGKDNLLGVCSPGLAIAAVAMAMALNVVLVATAAAWLLAARRSGQQT